MIHSCLVGAWPYTESVSNGKDFEPTSMHRSNTEDKLVVGNSNGDIKLFRFPVISKDVRDHDIYIVIVDETLIFTCF